MKSLETNARKQFDKKCFLMQSFYVFTLYNYKQLIINEYEDKVHWNDSIAPYGSDGIYIMLK